MADGEIAEKAESRGKVGLFKKVQQGLWLRNYSHKTIKALFLLSVWPFYGLLIAMMIIMRLWLL
jgi:hypothetical protein